MSSDHNHLFSQLLELSLIIFNNLDFLSLFYLLLLVSELLDTMLSSVDYMYMNFRVFLSYHTQCFYKLFCNQFYKYNNFLYSMSRFLDSLKVHPIYLFTVYIHSSQFINFGLYFFFRTFIGPILLLKKVLLSNLRTVVWSG